MSVVVVSRLVGSYGDEIAALVAEKLGYELIGQPQVHELAEACDPEFKDACALFERGVSSGFWERFFFSDPAYTSLFESLNYELASRGNAVIMGRGAQIVLGGQPGVFKVRVVAPTETRVKRIMEQQGISLEEAQEYVRRYDHQRKNLIQMIYEKDLADWTLYDLILNTVALSVEAGAEIVCHAVHLAPKPPNEGKLQEKFWSLALAKRVESAIKKRVPTTSYRDVKVSATETGVVTLWGYVQDKKSWERAEKIAAECAGVRSVENRLKTTGVRL